MKETKKKNIVIENRKAYHDYFVEETYECGIALWGNEVKSLRDGKASIKESWVAIENGEVLIKKMHVAPWNTANSFDIDETRERKLLMHKSEIRELSRKVQQDGYTLVPLKVYFSDASKVKVLIGLCKGKHDYDKRQVEKEKQAKREMSRASKGEY